MFPKQREIFLERRRNLVEFGGFLSPGEPPVELRNEEGRLHSETQPAYRSQTRITWYSDGRRHGMDADHWGSVTYYWRGVLIPEYYFLKRSELTIAEVLGHPNVEVRSVGMEIFGYDRLEREGHFRLVDRDDEKEMALYVYEDQNLHEPLTVIRLKNSTPERDGSHKIYYLTVPPTMTTCRQAVAWTFNKEASEYHPIIET